MAKNSKIEWTDATWNPIRGTLGNWHCTKISPGCEHCYAEKMNKRFRGPEYKVGADTLRLDIKALMEPVRWEKPRMIFVCSMTDLFHEDVPDEWILKLIRVMSVTPRHTFQVLTKRTDRAVEFFRSRNIVLPGNIWMGVTTENQQMAEDRIPLLLQVPAAVRFVSVEPMLGPIDFRFQDCWVPEDCYSLAERLHWLICGGESGPHARPMHPDWARNIRDQCILAGVPFFFKQWGRWAPKSHWRGPCPKEWGALTVAGTFFPLTTPWNGHDDDGEGEAVMYCVGKKAGGRVLDARTWDEFPGVGTRIPENAPTVKRDRKEEGNL